METEFINITEENADTEHLCCIIRTRTAHPGVETKRRWLKDRLKEGHVFRKLNINGTVFIEYAPLETAEQAKNLPCVFNNFAVFYNGKFKTVNQIDGAAVEKMIKRS